MNESEYVLTVDAAEIFPIVAEDTAPESEVSYEIVVPDDALVFATPQIIAAPESEPVHEPEFWANDLTAFEHDTIHAVMAGEIAWTDPSLWKDGQWSDEMWNAIAIWEPVDGWM